jgi:hypothetical protein
LVIALGFHYTSSHVDLLGQATRLFVCNLNRHKVSSVAPYRIT